ncbi:PPOX class F420-dependent oxidoreductase [Saccharopolyspora sp. HNM0983]|uniref:PPOX class F420-dependent oxidoreductase n=1 Tax=Saccharopolyspora montiporae TaxID=2781240 RepID=A0A929B7B6_9PSEU|nr:PPOX class F420-dependent oxidoreductase [Saccharopolyspora sp. HNM0983]MBE9373150.1 PPOX class F420-dependent oxidoreductase [Saccharopolyspora sp. HNM0983]
MTTIADPQVREFLEAGTRTGTVAYTGTDGRPLAAPVWFVLDGDELVFNTGEDTAKGRSLARDPRISVAVDLPEPPYAFVQVQGSVRMSADPDELLRTATRIAERYMGRDRAEEFGRRNGVPGELVVRLRPSKVLAAFDMVA